jgi:hypothetical protein
MTHCSHGVAVANPIADTNTPLVTAIALLGPLIDEAVYPDLKAIMSTLDAYAQENRCRIAVVSSTPLHVLYRCSKGGNYNKRFKDPTMHLSKQRKDMYTMKTD